MLNRRRKTLLSLVLVTLLVLPLLSGCWDRSEIDELGFVLAIGIDKGKQAKGAFTIWLAVPRQIGPSGGGGGGGGQSALVGTVEADSMNEALALMNTYIARRLTLEHAKAIVISQEAAKEDIFEYLAGLERNRSLRRNMLLIVTLGSAREFLEVNKPSIELDPARWMELMYAHQNFDAIVPKSTVHDFLTDEESPGSVPVLALAGVNPGGGGSEEKQGGDGSSAAGGRSLPGGAPQAEPGNPSQGAFLPGQIPRNGLNAAEVIGGAVIKRSKMVGTLNGNEVRFMSMIRGRMRRMTYPLPDPKFPGQVITLDVLKSRDPEIRISYQGTRPIISAVIRVEGDLTAVSSYYDWTSVENVPVLEQAVSKNMEDHARALVDRAQKEFGVDFLGFGEVSRRTFWTWKEWGEYDWQKHFPEAKVEIAVHFRLRRVGLQLGPPAPPTGLPQLGRQPGDGQGGAGQ